MKTYNNSFSFGRVGLLIKRDVVEKWKTFLFLTLALFLVFLFMMYAYSWIPFEVMSGYESFSLSVLNGCTTVFTYYSIFVFSGIMVNMRMQGDRTNFLMLPASNMEKFLTRMLYVTLLVFVPFIVGFLLADVLHMLLFPLLVDDEAIRTLPLLPGMWEVKSKVMQGSQEALNLVKLNIDLSSLGYALPIFPFIEAVWEASFFILGGCYWRKYPFAKTFALLMLSKIVAIVVIGISYVKIVREVEAPVKALEIWMDKLCMGISQNTLLYICAGVFFVWTLLNFYGAYRLFCRSQVVEPKRFKS
ncbi:MAG: hypothetical protein IKY31_01255 [Bacteroidaceae bacterium]|nr:hypothetical protein [Bacteroidaceae bacterium]